MNEKLNKALKRANMKIAEVKEKYKNKIVSKKCSYCKNDVDMSMMTVINSQSFDQV